MATITDAPISAGMPTSPYRQTITMIIYNIERKDSINGGPIWSVLQIMKRKNNIEFLTGTVGLNINSLVCMQHMMT